jgi:hypothetical protein
MQLEKLHGVYALQKWGYNLIKNNKVYSILEWILGFSPSAYGNLTMVNLYI